MVIRVWDIGTLLAIATGIIVAQLAGLEGVTTAFFGLCAVLVGGFVLGRQLLPGASGRVAAWWGSVATLATLMLLRGAWFYLGQRLGGWGDVWTTVIMLVAVAVGTLLLAFTRTDGAARRTTSNRRSLWMTLLEIGSLGVSVVGVALIGYVAWKLGTTDAIRTPWPLLPPWVLPMVGLLWALVLVNTWRGGRGWVSGIQAACAIGATAVIAPLLYQIGFGFDGFLHVAGESVLAKTGTLSPAPPYYMGQYVFVTWVAQLFSLSIPVVDKWLVAVTAVTLIPAAALFGRRVPTMLAALVLIPVAPFIATTPHGFAMTLAIAALLSYPQASVNDDDSTLPGITIALLLAAWAALTHPLVGLPILGAIIAAALWRIRHWVRYPLSLIVAIGAGIAVPLVFGLAASFGSSAGVGFNLDAVMNADAWGATIAALLPWTANRYALWTQASVWIEQLVPWIMVMLTVTAILRRAVDLIRGDADRSSPIGLPFIVAAGATFAAALVMQLAGDFNFLIDYERGNYTERLFHVALLLLLPVAIPTAAWLLARAKQATVPSAVGVILVVALLGAGATYAALPRHDAVTPSRGWSVSAADINTVRLIDRDAAGTPYTVLANQSVSAAAVREFGFARYYNDVFFYPIPTGGALYDVFLRASYEDPSRETMADAARLGGSTLVYLVINDYWWRANEISERAEAVADRAFVVDEGKVKVFKYIVNE